MWRWNELHQFTFDKIKELLTSPPVLDYPVFDHGFELHTDTSMSGLGAVLCQEQDGKKRTIAYASRSLTKSENNYSTFKLELLALRWDIVENFRDYLLSLRFVVYTDYNPLTYVLSSAKLEATGQRWVSQLSDFNFSIVYRPGSNNVDADVMSRYPHQAEEVCMDRDTIDAVRNSALLDVTEEPGHVMSQIELRELRKSQREDHVIGVWLRAVRDKTLPGKRVTAGIILI